MLIMYRPVITDQQLNPLDWLHNNSVIHIYGPMHSRVLYGCVSQHTNEEEADKEINL